MSELLPQQLGANHVRSELLGLEKIDPTAVTVGFLEKGALAGLPRTPQEEAFGACSG